MEARQEITPQFQLTTPALELTFVFLLCNFLFSFFMGLDEITLQMFPAEKL
jgi:hypothetical protein